jgi:hypothetical protein
LDSDAIYWPAGTFTGCHEYCPLVEDMFDARPSVACELELDMDRESGNVLEVLEVHRKTASSQVVAFVAGRKPTGEDEGLVGGPVDAAD